MRQMVFSVLLITLLAAPSLACKPSAPATNNTSASTSLLPNALKDASAIRLYEGLPHPSFEQEAFEAEKKSKPVEQHSGHAFYTEWLTLKPQDAEALSAILSDPKSLKPFVDGKKCGGFHPDYALQLPYANKQKSPTWALLCFGCQEIKIIDPNTNTDSTFDLSPDASEKLQTILKNYRKNRPAP